MVPPEERPALRPGQWISKEAAAEAFNSGSVETIRLALIDSSRCWEPAWVYPHAWRFIRHEDALVRWAAAFALGQARRELIRVLIAGDYDQNDDSPALVLTSLASDDPDPSVRNIAGSTLLDILGDLVHRLKTNQD